MEEIRRTTLVDIPVMAEMAAAGRQPEWLFWVGCAGAFDERYKKVTRSFARILAHCGVDFAVLGPEETCTGDPARRAGNEMLFQMQAMTNIDTFSRYQVRKIITICPHCFNTFRNEYPELGGLYEVIHHTQFLRLLMDEGKLQIDADVFRNASIVFHDPCYLGRANGEYEAPRNLIDAITARRAEMPRNRSKALCCGAGGAQMFKESESGMAEVNNERTHEALETGAGIIATACPFCMTMITDGLKYHKKEEEIRNLDIAEIIASALGLQ